ncbi:MAG: NAD+ synthase [Candidatus Nanohaloarchaea archaeon]
MRPEETREKITGYLKDYLPPEKSYVIGLSGGLDSATTLKLAVEAVGKKNVKALIMPGEPSRERNMQDARELASELSVRTEEKGIESIVSAYTREEEGLSREAEGNLRARIRANLLYMEANQDDSLVLGAGNRSEHLLGYFTKHGDEAADIKPIIELYKTEIKEIARDIGLDNKFIEKKPTAGLWSGQTDEEELGYSYSEIDPVLRELYDRNSSLEKTASETGLEKEEIREISNLVQRTSHKRGGAGYPGITERKMQVQ